MTDFVAMHDLALSDAEQQCGLALNAIGKSYVLLRGAQLPDRQHFDLRLRVDGDLARYDDIRHLISRIYGDQDAAKASTRGDSDATTVTT